LKFNREETVGIDRLIAGIAMSNKPDETRLERGAALFDDLYEYFRENMIDKKMLKTMFIVFMLVLTFYGFSVAGSGGAMNWQWNFETGTDNKPPSGFTFFRTGSGKQGSWIIQKEDQAPSGSYVLAQLDIDNTSYRFPIAVADEPMLRDFHLSVRCKPVAGKVDQACGLVFRYRDENNYYVARANALEGNVRFYHVSAGKRHELASWNGPVTSGTWHGLGVHATGDRFQVFWDNQKVIDARDSTFRESGKIGVWTKADSITYFDDLTVETKEGR
jgi:hypothetical protein